MVMKKVMVGCLIASLLIGGNGAVLANSLDTDVGVLNETGINVSEVGIPASVEGSHEFKCKIGQVTVEQLSSFLKSCKVLDSEGNDLGISDQLIIVDAKHKSIPLETIVNRMNSATSYSYDLIIGLADYYAVGTYALMVEDTNSDDVVTGNVVYSTHVQNVGWQAKVADGKMSGTEGRSLRLEGITIESGIEGVGVEYATHVQNIGWQDFVTNGKMSGTEGMSYRLEAIRIRLTGENADKYDVVYRVHAQNVGWMGYAMNGESSGTAGYGYRLEGIEIQIVEKGSFTGDTTNAYKDLNDDRTTAAYADAKYGNIINEYSQFLQNGAVNASDYEHVNINTNMHNRSQEPYLHDDVTLDYTYEDINSDDVYELIIAVSHTVNPQRGGYPFVNEQSQTYDMYTINDEGVPVRIIDEPDADIEKWYTLYQNNIVMTFNRTTSYCAETYLKDNRLVEKRVGYWKDVSSLSNWIKDYGLKRDLNITWKHVTDGVGQF